MLTLMFRVMSRTGKTTAAALVTKKGGPVYEWDDADKGILCSPESLTFGMDSVQTVEISNNPDFTSILRVEDKIFSITHYESPRPGVAYLSELEQHQDGSLTVRSS